MASWAEAKQSWLMTQLSVSTPDSIKNLERRYLYSQLSVTDGSIHELWKDWLIAKPQVTSTDGPLIELWDEYLTALGYSGTVREKQKAFFEA